MIELNKDGLAASEGWMQHQSATFGLHWKNAKPIIEAYFDTIHESDAPALALAILESAGWPNEHLATTEILRRLRELDEHVKAVEAEARERAELEAEAEALYRVYFETAEMDYKNWEKLEQRVKDYWLAVARRAREMRAEK